jgi:hypothetical protein
MAQLRVGLIGGINRRVRTDAVHREKALDGYIGPYLVLVSEDEHSHKTELIVFLMVLWI